MNPHPGLLADIVKFSWVDGPGNRYVLFLQGCNFDCTACHNPHTIPLVTSRARLMTVAQVIDDIRPVRRFLSGITVSGGEATLQPRFVHDLFHAMKTDPDLNALTTFLDTNGNAPRSTWARLLPVTDGAMVDLKALDPDVHIALTDSVNDDVLASIRHLAEVGKLYEVRLLLVPGINDTEDQLRRTPCRRKAMTLMRIAGSTDSSQSAVRASARHWPEATPERRQGWQDVLEDAGVRRLELV